MSNPYSATLAAPRAVPARPASNAKPSIWRRVFDYWLLAYSTRVDMNGNVICEL